MTAPPYPADHPRADAAARFSVELRKALMRRKLRPFQLQKAIGLGVSGYQMHLWLQGGAIPRLETAGRIAEALEWPTLAEIVREARTGVCERAGCGKTFVTEGGRARKYCSARCRQLVHDYDLRYSHARRKGNADDSDDLERRALELIAQIKADTEERDTLRSAVEAMCQSCEPEGVCRTPDCPLRTVSPLPLAQVPLPSTDKRLLHVKTGRAWSTPFKLPARKA